MLSEGWDGYRMNHCFSCDVVFSDPMKGPGREWYEKDENSAAHKLHDGFEEGLGWNHRQFLGENIQARTLLDIGCGRGTFLKEAGEREYVTSGIDFDRMNVELAKTRLGLHGVYAETVEEFMLKNQGKRFDVVTFFEVLEHIPEPRKFLSLVHSMVSPDGYIALSVPNRARAIDTIGYLDGPPYHLTRWTDKALRSVLQLEGFEVVRLEVKPIEANDVSSVLRLGIGRRLIKAGLETNRAELLSCAALLYRVKRKVAGIIAFPILMLLRMAGCQGTSLYCLARVPKAAENLHTVVS